METPRRIEIDRIVVADDHPLFREALLNAVSRAAPDAQVVACSSLAEVEAALDQAPATLVLLDLKMPDCEGFAGLLAVRGGHPATPVVIVSAAEEPETIRRALAFGAAGYIPKSADMQTMTAAINTVLEGEVWAPPVEGAAAEPDPRLSRLTPAQLKILVGLQKGRLNKQIAYDMGVTEATVKAHMTAIFRKLGVLNRTQAVLVAKSLEL